MGQAAHVLANVPPQPLRYWPATQDEATHREQTEAPVFVASQRLRAFLLWINCQTSKPNIAYWLVDQGRHSREHFKLHSSHDDFFHPASPPRDDQASPPIRGGTICSTVLDGEERAVTKHSLTSCRGQCGCVGACVVYCVYDTVRGCVGNHVG